MPGWEELPQIGLYMDQVIALIDQYLGFFAYTENAEKLLTPSMVNNYVKLKLLPPPVRKRYGRRQIAYLIMICTLKQCLSMAVVREMLPPDDEDAVRRDYEHFVAVHKRLAMHFTRQVKERAEPIFDVSADTGTEVNDLVVGSAVAASFAKLMAGKLVALRLPE